MSAPAERYRDLWTHMFGDRHDTLELVSVKPNDWKTAQYGHFNYPDQLDEAEQWVLTRSVGRDVWHCAHLLMSPKKTTGLIARTKDNASAVLTLYADLDGCPLPADFPQPTAIVESSPGRMHCYWRLTRPLQPHDAERLNKRLAAAIGADPSGFDLTQLLRVPGTFNFKYPQAPPVTVTHLDAKARYDPIELAKALPPLPEEARPAAPTAAATPVNLPDDVLIEKAKKSQPKFARLWNGNLSDYVDAQHPGGDPSRADAAFCTIAAFWTGKDPARVEAWWLTAPGLKRDKLQRDDYRALTIASAIAVCKKTYDPDRPAVDPHPTPANTIKARGSDGAEGCLGCHHCPQVPQLAAELNRLLERDRAREKLRKTGWSGEERAAIEHIAQRVDAARREGRDAITLYYPNEKEASGVGAATFTRVVKRIEAHQKAGDIVPVKVVREKTSNGKPKVQLTIDRAGRLTGDLAAFAALRRDDPQHGGNNGRCKRHPDEAPVTRIVDQQLRRTIRQWICPVDGEVLDEKYGPLVVVAETVTQVDPSTTPIHDETIEDEPDLEAGNEVDHGKPSEPAGPFHHETSAAEGAFIPSRDNQGRHSETVAQPTTAELPFHHETVPDSPGQLLSLPERICAQCRGPLPPDRNTTCANCTAILATGRRPTAYAVGAAP